MYCRFMQRGVHSFVSSGVTEDIYIPQFWGWSCGFWLMGFGHRVLVMHSAILRRRWTMGHFVLFNRKNMAPPVLLLSMAAGLTGVQES